MFYSDLYVKGLGSVLFWIVLLLRFSLNLLQGFCLKNLDLSDQQIAHIDLYLITLFVVVTFLSKNFLYLFFTLNNMSICLVY